MKKTKILAVLGICFALGIVACNKGNNDNPGGDSKTSQKSEDSHKHSFGKWTQTVAPTCTEPGKEERVCECGEKEEREVKALGHDFENGTIVSDTATCTVDGKLTKKCARCDETKEYDSKAHHDFDAAQPVAAGTDPADQVGYTLANCKKGDAIQVDIKAVDAKFYKGSIKSGTPEGYFKLNSKNDKAYWKFTLAGDKMYKGMLYQRGAMDSFSSNTTKSYASTSTSGDNAPEYTKGNFDCVVNGDSLDKTEWIRITFEELLAEGDDSSAMGDNYSPLCLCPIGEAVLQPGLNEITYERLGSYNLIISDLIFIGSEFEHVHAAATEWSSDENNHWHACTAPGCPTGKLDVAAHTFEEVAAEGVAATCAAEGKKVEKCSVCGHKKETVLPKLAHTLGEAYDVVPAACEADGSQKKKCSVCEEVVTEVLPKLPHTFGDAVENYAAGEGYIASTAHNCSVCGKSALRWSAIEYDATKTIANSTCEPESRDSGKAVRFGAPKENNTTVDGAENFGQDETKKGTHLVYNINVPAAGTFGLEFYTSARTDQQLPPVFDKVEGDGTKGYDKVGDQWVRPESRYGVKVDGQVVTVGKDNSGQTWNGKAWYIFPVELTFAAAGAHEIEVYAYGGYRVDMYNFQLTGLPHVTPSHLHTLGDWQSDDNNHWKVCSGEGCPSPEGTHLEEAPHTFGEVNVTTAPTCEAAGAGEKECTVCGKKVEVVIPALGHDFAKGTAVKNSLDKDVTPITCSKGDAEGYEMALADYTGTENAIASDGKLAKSAELTWKFKLTQVDGAYKVGKIAFIMCAKLNGGTAYGASAPADNAFANDYSLKVGEKAGTVTCAGKQLGADFGATVDNAVYFEFGTIEFTAEDLVDGELAITVKEAANQSYRHRYQDNVRIIYVA